MKLATRDFPLVRFREELPAWLQPTGKAYLEIDARPIGKVNLPFMAGRNAWAQAKAAADKGAEAPVTDDQGRDWLELIYDTAVIAWRTNLINDDTKEPVEPTRESFLELAQLPLVELQTMFLRFQNEAMKAATDVLAADEATLKN